MYFAGNTDKGLVRSNNEDFFYAKRNLLIVADGMGGHNAGEVASKLAVDTVISVLDGIKENYEESLIQAIKEANKVVFEKATGEQSGMGTTIDICICDKDKIYLGHVGDSRVYVIRDGKAIKITEDHSYVELLVQKGEITADEAKDYPMKNMITKAIGVSNSIEGDFYEFALKKGDKILLCTDGLTNMLTDGEIVEVISKSENVDEAADVLIKKANAAGGKDNITVIVAEDFFD